MSAYTYRTSMTLHFHDGDEHDFDLVIKADVSPGSPESGRFGRPEDYDAGSPDEVHIESLRAFRSDKTEAVAVGQMALLLARSDEALQAAIAESWREDQIADRDHAREMAADERRLSKASGDPA